MHNKRFSYAKDTYSNGKHLTSESSLTNTQNAIHVQLNISCTNIHHRCYGWSTYIYISKHKHRESKLNVCQYSKTGSKDNLYIKTTCL